MNERDLFMAALQIEDAAERSAYLGRECASDAELRQRVEALLAAFEQAGSFLQRPAGEPKETRDAPPLADSNGHDTSAEPGTLIGPYKLIEQIGEGGMGTVWMAQQTEPVKRVVALKLIKAGMDSRQVIARFEAERQALALMDHPNIARVLDGGTTSAGRPYFVMDLVKGVPITKYCDEHHLTPKQRLELFIPVCEAVQHAHQKGIIHRDLKPSNVLVAQYDGKPAPKVIDFGVAKAAGQSLTDKTLVTGFGNLVGTLEYMSPEQAQINQLDIDTRSDIYSLGVLLYELLTGAPPFAKKDLEHAGLLEMLRVIREQEPSKPSTKLSTAEGLPTLAANRGTEPAKLTKLVRGDLDWIVMKALEKDRGRRYETANGFAQDVKRYLADEPVQACPPSVGYRFRKFARRNKSRLAVAAVLGIALVSVLGAVAGSIGWVVHEKESRRAVAAAEVNQFIRRSETLYIENRLPEAGFEAEKARGQLEAGGGSKALRQAVRALLADLEMSARLEELRLEWYDHAEDARSSADHDRAFREYGIDVGLLPRDEATARIAASRIRLDLVLGLSWWANRLERDHRKNDPERVRLLREVANAADPDPWRTRARAAARKKDVRALLELAESADLSGSHLRSLTFLAGNIATAGARDEAIGFLRKVQRQHPGDFTVNYMLGAFLGRGTPRRWDEAIGFFRASLAVRQRSAQAYTQLGWCLSGKREFDEAVAACREAVRLQPSYAEAQYFLGVVLHKKGDLAGATAPLRESLRLRPENPDYRTRLGAVLLAQGEFDAALTEYREAVRAKPDFVVAHAGIGATFRKKGAAGGGEAMWDAALAAYRDAARIDPDHPFVVYGRAHVLREKGDLEAAVTAFRDAFKKWPKDRQVAGYAEPAGEAMNDLAWDLATNEDPSKRDPARAVELAKEAVDLAPREPAYWNSLGVAHYRAGDFAEAVTVLRKGMELANGGDGTDWFFLAMATWRLGQQDEARAWYERAAKWVEESRPEAKSEDQELRRFQAEAAELLNINSKKD